MDFFWISLAVFLVSSAFLVHDHFSRKNEVKAQFVVTGCLLVVFYCVCFFSGICTILNFLWKWVL
jgi:hypothetical protein